MKLTVQKTSLLEKLQMVQNIVGPRTTLPILSNVLLEAEKGKLWLSTTDLDVSIRCGVEAEVAKSGSTSLNVKRLGSIVRELAEENIEIEVDDKDTATIKCGASFFKIIGITADEFPVLPKLDSTRTYSLTQTTFKDMMRKTLYAASSDETRQVLNGVLLSFQGKKLSVVATDGRRLALAEYELDFPKEGEIDMIVPAKAVSELLHTLRDEGELKIVGQKNLIGFEFDDVLVVSKLIEGTYPNYKRVIPSSCEERVALEREELLAVLRRVSLLTTDKSNSVKLEFSKNKLQITSNTPDVGEAREIMATKYTGKDISVAFNPEYIMDPLRNLDNDAIFFELTDDLSPGVIKTDSPFLYVLMPMRSS